MKVRSKIGIAVSFVLLLLLFGFFCLREAASLRSGDTSRSEPIGTGEMPGRSEPASGRVAIPPRPPAAPSPPPSPLAPEWLDPCSGDLAAHAAPPRSGGVEGIVLRATRFDRGGDAWIHEQPDPPDFGSAECVGCLATDFDPRARVDLRGTFRFGAVAVGSYCVGIEIGDGVSHVRVCRVEDGVPTRRVVFVLGDAQVRGKVYDSDGTPLSGVSLRIDRRDDRWNPTGDSASTRTGPDGAYRLTGFCPGAYAMEARIGADPNDPRNGYYLIELAAGEMRTIDFGSPRGLGVWRGRVLGPDAGSLTVAPDLLVQHRDDARMQGVLVAGDGSFEVELAPGRYTLKAQLLREWREIGEISMSRSDLHRDVTLPPASIAVTVRHLGTRHPGLLVFLSRRDSPETLAMAKVGTDGFHFFGVPPGNYEVWAQTSPLPGERGERLPVHVAPADRRVQVEILTDDR